MVTKIERSMMEEIQRDREMVQRSLPKPKKTALQKLALGILIQGFAMMFMLLSYFAIAFGAPTILLIPGFLVIPGLWLAGMGIQFGAAIDIYRGNT